MRKLTIFFLFLFKMATATGQAPVIPVIGFEALEPFLHKQNDTVYVVNFWATWCQPCVKELPYLEKLTKKYRAQPVKVLLVSLDFKSQLASKLIPFVKSRKIRSEVVLLHDLDANDWIPKVSEVWEGAIPLTLIYRGDQRHIQLEAFERFADLEVLIKRFL